MTSEEANEKADAIAKSNEGMFARISEEIKKREKAYSTAKQMLARAKELEDKDREEAHYEADGALLVLLRAYGFDDICDEFHDIEKWYS